MRELVWIEELLPSGIVRKAMFGGYAYYYENRMVLALFEKTGDRVFKNKKYNFELWNGCLFPTEREHHEDLQKRYPFLNPHPVLPKWLYLPLDTEDFDTHVESIIIQIRKRNLAFGIVPKQKTKKIKVKVNSKIKIKNNEIDHENTDTRRPRMFEDEPAASRLQSAKKISDLKNLGHSSEKEFNRAGIKTVKEFVKLGWKKSMLKLVKSNRKNTHSVFAYAVIGALKNLEWNKISEQEKLEARLFMKELRNKLSK